MECTPFSSWNGAGSKNAAYIERTKHVVIAYVSDDAFLAINIFEHEQWEDQSIIESLHRNWPETISDYQLRGIRGESLTNEQRRAIRKKNLQASITVSDGTTYGSIGGGVSSAGTRIQSVIQADMLAIHIKGLQVGLQNELPTLIPHLQSGGYEGQEEIEAQLHITTEGYKALFPRYGVLASITVRED